MNAIERWNRLEVRSGEWRLCLVANRWGTRRTIARFFGLISRAGDGVFWYSLMGALAIFGGVRGAQAALHMAMVGLIALALYRSLKKHTRRPRPFRAHEGIVAHIPPLDEYSFPSGHTLHAVSFSLVAIAYFPLLATVLIPFTEWSVLEIDLEAGRLLVDPVAAGLTDDKDQDPGSPFSAKRK